MLQATQLHRSRVFNDNDRTKCYLKTAYPVAATRRSNFDLEILISHGDGPFPPNHQPPPSSLPAAQNFAFVHPACGTTDEFSDNIVTIVTPGGVSFGVCEDSEYISREERTEQTFTEDAAPQACAEFCAQRADCVAFSVNLISPTTPCFLKLAYPGGVLSAANQRLYVRQP